MPAFSPVCAQIGPEIVLDPRLGLFHQREKWLAVADLHFGFELSQRAAGRLVPFWGMESTRNRLFQLVEEYRPAHLILIGDLVHDAAAIAPLRELLRRLGQHCEVIAVAGNHDRSLRGLIPLVDSFATRDFEFHHGHRAETPGSLTQVIGHFHPAAVLRDGAGLHLKFPAFVQQDRCWVMPAFSPWSAGTVWSPGEQSRIWLCSPHRILALANQETAA